MYRTPAPFRRFAALLLAACAAAFLPGVAAAGSARPTDREQIAELIYCYARGTDAIGDATTNADPLAAGLAIYQPCFAPDAEIRAWFPQQPFDSQTFPNPDANPKTAPQAYRGAAAWAAFVNSVFRGNGYTFTQHAMSNVEVSVQGETGRLTAYLNATHVRSGSAVGGPSRCVAVANGTYSAEVRRFGERWKITKLSLTLIAFNPVFQSGAGC